MILAIPYLISFIIGYSTLLIILKNNEDLGLLKLTLAPALGLGISALLTFLSFGLCGQYNVLCIRFLNIAATVIVLTAALIIQFKGKQINLKNLLPGKTDSVMIISWAIIGYIVYILANDHPFGQWDAWALWNMKIRYLIISGDSWTNLFQLHWHTQPDYPLLLPMMNIWCFSIVEKNPHQITLLTAVVLTVSCAALLYTALRQFTSRLAGSLAFFLLALNPYYLYLATAQYADILLAIYLLSSLTVMLLLVQKPQKSFAVLLGIFLGLMTFTKNEGIVISILLILICFFHFYLEHKQKLKPVLFPLVCSTLLFSIQTILFKLFLAPVNRDIFVNPLSGKLKFFNLDGLFIIGNFIISVLSDVRWLFVGFLILFMLVTGTHKLFKKEYRVITIFFISYSLIVLFIYLTTANFDLSWRLSKTLLRIFFYLLPSALFFAFFIHWRDESCLNK